MQTRYCTYKSRTVIVNEYNIDCNCRLCHFTTTRCRPTCVIRIIDLMDDDSRREREKKCRGCIRLTNQIQKQR